MKEQATLQPTVNEAGKPRLTNQTKKEIDKFHMESASRRKLQVISTHTYFRVMGKT